jgi:hypothetical protein
LSVVGGAEAISDDFVMPCCSAPWRDVLADLAGRT